MKVCFVSIRSYPIFNPKVQSHFGGAEVQIANLAKEMSRHQDISTHLIVGDFGQQPIEKSDKLTLWKSFKPGRPLIILSGIVAQWQLYFLMKKIDADIYIQRAAGIETATAALFCRLNDRKFTYMTAHEKDCSGEYVNKRYGLLDKIIGRLFQWGLKNADQIIAQSQEQRKLLKKTFSKDSVILSSSYPMPKKRSIAKNIILWVARAVEWKQPEIFIKIANAIPDSQFVMVCPNDLKPDYYHKIKRMANRQHNLKFFDQIPFKKIDKFFERALIFVNTSRYEGFPNTFVQAAMHGTPIVSLTVNPDNFIDKYQCGSASRGNVERMIESIKFLINDRSLYRTLSSNALRYARQHHDVSANVIQLKENLYHLALS